MSNYQGKKSYQQKQSGGGYDTQYVPKQTKEPTYDTYNQYVPKQKQETNYETSAQYVPKKTQDYKYESSTQYAPKQKQESTFGYEDDDYDDYEDDYDSGYKSNQSGGYRGKRGGGERGGGGGGRYNKSYQGDKGQGQYEQSGGYYQNKNEGGGYYRGKNEGGDKGQGKYEQSGSYSQNKNEGGGYYRGKNEGGDKGQGQYEQSGGYSQNKNEGGGYYRGKNEGGGRGTDGSYKKKGYSEESETSTKTSYQQQAQDKKIAEAFLEYKKLAQEAHTEEKAELAPKKFNKFGQDAHTQEKADLAPKKFQKYAQEAHTEEKADLAPKKFNPKTSDFGHQRSINAPSFSLYNDSTATSYSKGSRGDESKLSAMLGYDFDEDFGEQSASYGDGSTDAGTHDYDDKDSGMVEDTTAGYHEEEQPPTGTSLVLMVAEKPSIAKSVAEALSNGKYKTRKGIGRNQTLEFRGNIFGYPAHFRVTSVTGHVFNADFPKEYQRWDKVDPAELFYIKTIKRLANPKGKTTQHLSREARNCNYLVLWLDNDKEGENICFEVLDCCKGTMRKEKYQQIFRAKFSSLVKQDLVAAFKALRDGPNYNESISVDARQIIDLKIGVTFSRFQTSYFRQKYQSLEDNLITYGPCQTPTLGFCVARTEEIENFVPRTFYRICPSITVTGAGKFDLLWCGDRLFHQADALAIRDAVEKAKEAEVISVHESEAAKSRPQALNTVHMLKIASSNLGLGPNHAMHVAEKLYLSGYLTYPRTESTSYPENFDFDSVVKALGGVKEYESITKTMLSLGINRPKKGVDVGDHPPITPTQKAFHKGGSSSDEWRLYDFVCRNFMATISYDAKYIKKNILFRADKQEFELHGVKVISRGFTDIMVGMKISDAIIPDFVEGERYPLTRVDVKQGETSPPDHLSESDLISLMEKHGIGTDASMATHINNICVRNYVTVDSKGRRLIPTELGISLVKGYKAIDPDLVAPDLRGNIERSVDEIAKGKADYINVLDTIISTFAQKFDNFRKNIQKMESIFSDTFSKIVNVSRVCDVIFMKPTKAAEEISTKETVQLPKAEDLLNDEKFKAETQSYGQLIGKKKLTDKFNLDEI